MKKTGFIVKLVDEENMEFAYLLNKEHKFLSGLRKVANFDKLTENVLSWERREIGSTYYSIAEIIRFYISFNTYKLTNYISQEELNNILARFSIFDEKNLDFIVVKSVVNDFDMRIVGEELYISINNRVIDASSIMKELVDEVKNTRNKTSLRTWYNDEKIWDRVDREVSDLIIQIDPTVEKTMEMLTFERVIPKIEEKK